MEFKEFCRERKRMCKSIEIRMCDIAEKLNYCCLGCKEYCINHPDEAEEIISKWAEEHPVVTNMDKFREVFGDNLYIEEINDLYVIITAINGEIKGWLKEEYRPPRKEEDDD